MNTLIPTYSINLNNLKLKDKEISDNETLIDLLCENEGSFTTSDQYMTFDCDGIEVMVNFTLDVDGRIEYDPGDYWTPPSGDAEITDIDVNITDVYIDEYDVELTREMRRALEKEVKKYLD
jgi:hypothetical protein